MLFKKYNVVVTQKEKLLFLSPSVLFKVMNKQVHSFKK